MAETSHRKDKKMTDAEEIREILTAVSDSIPQLISSLFESIFNEKSATNLAISIGTLYSKLKEQGLPEDMIREIVNKYIALIPSDLGDLLSEAQKSGHGGKKSHHKEPKDKTQNDNATN